MFDPIRNQYSFRCPATDSPVWTSVSGFRVVRRLRGATSPAVFRVEYDCECGQRHETLITHDRLDWEPLGTDQPLTFTNLLTGTRELASVEFADAAHDRIRRGKWPWTFWCHPERAARPGFPSSLRFVTPQHEHGPDRVGVLVRCYTCQRHTVNIVSPEHLDVPWHQDPAIMYVDELFDGEELSDEERFRHQLWSGASRERWLRSA